MLMLLMCWPPQPCAPGLHLVAVVVAERPQPLLLLVRPPSFGLLLAGLLLVLQMMVGS